MNTNYAEVEDYNEAEDLKLIAAQAELGSELLALGLPDVAVMVSMNGEGFTCYLDVSREEREDVYTKFAKAFDIEIDEDENFYSEVNEALAKRLDNLFDWN